MSGAIDGSSVLAAIERILAPILARFDLRLYDIELHRGRKRSLLRVTIDRPGQGVDVEDCARVSEVLSEVLDVEDPIPGAYNLEVSSPGLDRKLVKPRHYRGSLGSLVRAQLRNPPGKTVEGILRAFEGEPGKEEVTFEVAGAPVRIALADLARAELVLVEPPRGKP
ncbi:MAG: ribosome maturation factor RimP [Acidobacteriota bacterium]